MVSSAVCTSVEHFLHLSLFGAATTDTTDWGPEQQTFLTGSDAGKSKPMQVLGDLVPGTELSSCFANGHLLTVSSHRARELSGVLFIKKGIYLIHEDSTLTS